MAEKAEVTKVGFLSMQVCVPSDWSNDQIDEFANREVLCGTTHGWSVSGREEVAPVPCEKRQGFKHVLLDC